MANWVMVKKDGGEYRSEKKRSVTPLLSLYGFLSLYGGLGLAQGVRRERNMENGEGEERQEERRDRRTVEL